MLHVNEDNDGIFRKAAEAYPLDTGNGNWEAVRKKLVHPDEEEESVAAPGKRNYMGLFILAIIGLGLPFLTRDLLHTHLPGTFIQKQTPFTNVTGSPSPITGFQSPEVLQIQNPTSKKIGIIHTSTPVLNDLAINKIPVNNAIALKPDPVQGTATPGINTEMNISQENPQNTGMLKNIQAPSSQQQIEKKSTAGNDISKSSTKTDNDQKKKLKRIYAGVLGGADISMIKLQGANKIGHSYGIRVGYQVSHRIAIESGIQSDKKYYKTSGQYFNTKKIRLPQYAEIVSAAGNCDMYEVPLQVRYSFKPKKKTGISVFAGASAYMMKKEDYTYQVKRNNYIYPRQVSYNKSDTRLIAAINTGITVQYKLGKSGSLLAEPYVKLPVSHMGTGLLPIQSAGIQLGYTRSIF